MKKYERTIGSIEDNITSIQARKMTARDTEFCVLKVYGFEIGPALH